VAAAGGALVMQACFAREARAGGDGPAPVGGAAAAAPVQIGAYLSIATDGSVSIVVPSAELGQGVYTSLPMLLAEELDADWSRTSVRLAPADPAFGNPARGGVQVTGASDSVVGYFELLRRLGASARDMLVRAAAAEWGVAPSACRTEASEVLHADTGRRLGYGALAGRAALLQPVQEPPLKKPAEFRLLGRSPGRKDSPAKSDGSARFGADLRLPGVLFGAVVLAPAAGSRLVGFDRESALRRRGVHAVTEVDGGLGAVAETTWLAEQALREAAPRFEGPGGEPQSGEQVAAALRAALELPGRPARGAAGDAVARMSERPPVLDVVYEVPLLAHVCMEPMAATAWLTDSHCHVWAPHQRQGAAREAAAAVSGLPVEQVTLEGTFCGGGFGRKWEVDFVRHAVQLAAAVRGRPVAMTWSRHSDLRGDYYRAPFAWRVRGALDGRGGIDALHVRMAGPSLLTFQQRPIAAPDPSSVGGAILPQYAIANRLVEFVERPVRQRIGFWRAVSLSQNGFLGESVIDELAHHAQADALEFRRRLLAADSRALAVLDRAATESGWSRPLPAGSGRGIAFSSGFGSYHAQVAQVRVEGARVIVERVTCVHDCGFAIDPDTVVAQMEGGIVFGLSALVESVGVVEDAPQPTNFHEYPILNLLQMPRIDVHVIDSGAPVGGVGEAATAVIMPAVTNAIFHATGRRIRRLPISLEGFELG
jgi:isoquinoline 1-oxidoreductase beta subunit